MPVGRIGTQMTRPKCDGPWVAGFWRSSTSEARRSWARNYLRSHPEAAAGYAQAKQRAWADGARTLLQYSEAKRTHVAAVVANAKKWQAG